MIKPYIPVYHHPVYAQTAERQGTRPPDAKAADNPVFNPEARYNKLLDSVHESKTAPASTKEKWKSKFQPGQQALFRPTPATQRFHQRTTDLNQIPIFHAGYATEIAKPEDINRLPTDMRAKELERLYAKRMVGADGKSLHAEDPNDTSNPPLHAQDKRTREMRVEAATATISNFSGEYIARLYDHVTKDIDTKQPEKFFVIRPTRHPLAEDTTVNFLSAATQTEVTESLNALARRNGHAIEFSDQKNMYVLSRTARSTASPIGRIVQQGYLDTSELKKGDKIIIADDHTQAGGTLLAMAAAAREADATVIAAATPTTHPFCKTLCMSDNVKSALDQTLNQWDKEGKVRHQLAEFGMPVDTLTNFDAMIIIAYTTDPENAGAVQNYKKLENELFGDNRVLEGKGDSLIPILNQKPMTPDEVVKEMIDECGRSRKVTAAVVPKNIHVFDWDDTLRDEKGMNYQLMHNALAVAAHKHGQNHPLLVDLAKAVDENRGKYSPGMPLLCMKQKDYSDYTIQHEMLKKDMVTDLLNKMGALDPALKVQYDQMSPTRQSEELQSPVSPRDLVEMHGRAPRSSKEGITNILYNEFSRQYQLMIRPEVDSDLKYQEEAKVPFPHVTPELMAGAQALLDKIRNPDNAVLLISNKGDRYVRSELAKLGLEHYFDAISGTPEVTVFDQNGGAKVKRIDSKPSPAQLQRAVTGRHDLDDAATVTSWGDTPKDITQILRAIKQGVLDWPEKFGVIVNPSTQIQDQTMDALERSKIPDALKPTGIAVNTLSDEGVAAHLARLEEMNRRS